MFTDETSFSYFIVLGTLILFFFTVVVIFFVVFYQRRIFAKQNEILRLEEQKKEALTEAIISTKESEKRWIAHELLDEIGSNITLLRMSLMNAAIEKETKQTLNDELNELSNKVKRIAKEMLPPVLDEVTLVFGGGRQNKNDILDKILDSGANCPLDNSTSNALNS